MRVKNLYVAYDCYDDNARFMGPPEENKYTYYAGAVSPENKAELSPTIIQFCADYARSRNNSWFGVQYTIECYSVPQTPVFSDLTKVALTGYNYGLGGDLMMCVYNIL